MRSSGCDTSLHIPAAHDHRHEDDSRSATPPTREAFPPSPPSRTAPRSAFCGSLSCFSDNPPTLDKIPPGGMLFERVTATRGGAFNSVRGQSFRRTEVVMSQVARRSERRLAGGTTIATRATKSDRRLLDHRLTTVVSAAGSSRLGSGSIAGIRSIPSTALDLLRRGGSVPALLLAVLLTTLMIDCGLLESYAHTHTSISPIEDAGHVHVHGHDHEASGDPDHHRCPHLVHCLIKSLLPGNAPTAPPPYLLELISPATVVAFAAALSQPAGGVRAPPGRSLPAEGRGILTRLCIARR